MSTANKLPLFPTKQSLTEYFSPVWWQHTLRFSWLFRRQLLVPAILFFVASCLSTQGVNTMQSLNGMSNEIQDAGPLLSKVFFAFGCLSLGGILLIVAMTLSIFKLAVFSRAFLLFTPPKTAADIKEKEYSNAARKSQEESGAALRTHKGYLAKSWGLSTLVMTPLIFIFMVSSFWTVFLSMPDTTTYQIPPEFRKMLFTSELVSVVDMVFMSNFSIVVMAVTCMLNLSVGASTRRSILLALTTSPLLTLLSAVVLALSTAISTPYVVAAMIQPAAQWYQSTNVPATIAWEFWQAASSIILYPLSMALLLQSLRDCIQKEEKIEEANAI